MKLRRTTEDYLKTIYLLSQKTEVHGAHIAEELGVSKPTVSVSLKALEREGYLTRDENHAVIRAGYCPLMHAWVECGGDEAQVAKLCDIAMDADRAQVNSIPALSFSLRKSLAEGDDQCEFLVELCKQEEESK